MAKIKLNLLRVTGVMGTVAYLAIFVARPSFPTPDKLVIFLTFLFMAFSQAIKMLRRLLPFVGLILVYESFRGIIHSLNSHVNYTLAPHIDKFLFGGLPTSGLQKWLWQGRVQWYDFLFYLAYMLFFVLPLGLAILVWKTRDQYYWRVVSTYLVLFFSSFMIFLLFPAAPPWLAAQEHIITPITRISSEVWYSLGIRDFPSLYNHIAANPVAAVPSLHAGAATLLAIFIFKIYGRRWGFVSLIYPALIYVGVVYQGEHYVFDVMLGIVYGIAAYVFTPYLMKVGRRAGKLIISRARPVVPKEVQ